MARSAGVVCRSRSGHDAEDELFGGEGGVGVEHVDLLAVGAGGFEEGEAVGLVLGEGLFVAVDDLVGVVVEVAEGDEAAAFADLVGSGNGVGLGVAVDGGLGLFGEDAAPCASRGGTRRRGCRRCGRFAWGRNSWGSVSPGSCLPRMTRTRLYGLAS